MDELSTTYEEQREIILKRLNTLLLIVHPFNILDLTSFRFIIFNSGPASQDWQRNIWTMFNKPLKVSLTEVHIKRVLEGCFAPQIEMLITALQYIPKIFSESAGIFGYQVFEKVTFLLRKFTNAKLLYARSKSCLSNFLGQTTLLSHYLLLYSDTETRYPNPNKV